MKWVSKRGKLSYKSLSQHRDIQLEKAINLLFPRKHRLIENFLESTQIWFLVVHFFELFK